MKNPWHALRHLLRAPAGNAVAERLYLSTDGGRTVRGPFERALLERLYRQRQIPEDVQVADGPEGAWRRLEVVFPAPGSGWGGSGNRVRESCPGPAAAPLEDTINMERGAGPLPDPWWDRLLGGGRRVAVLLGVTGFLCLVLFRLHVASERQARPPFQPQRLPCGGTMMLPAPLELEGVSREEGQGEVRTYRSRWRGVAAMLVEVTDPVGREARLGTVMARTGSDLQMSMPGWMGGAECQPAELGGVKGLRSDFHAENLGLVGDVRLLGVVLEGRDHQAQRTVMLTLLAEGQTPARHREWLDRMQGSLEWGTFSGGGTASRGPLTGRAATPRGVRNGAPPTPGD